MMAVNIKRLSEYIKSIDQGRSINFVKFRTLVDNLNLDRESNINDIQARKQKGQLYVVTYIKADLMVELRSLVANSGDSRAGAARQNRSHSQKVNGSFIIARQGENAPSVVMIDPQGEYISSLNYSSKALIIENRQNFINISTMIRFLSVHTDFAFESGMNVIFSEGNAITNALHKPFLSQYTHIYLCMDFDLGGLKIANNLMNLLPELTINFLVPDDIEQRLAKVSELADKAIIQEISEIGMRNERLAPYAKVMRDKQKILEQEEYLND